MLRPGLLRAREIVRCALIADIHANLPALEAVLARIDASPGVDALFHLGDLVGYAPWPDETVALLDARGIAGVSGNYDSTVALAYKHCGCQYEDPVQEALSHRSFAWTLAHTGEHAKHRLGALPSSLTVRPLGAHMAGPKLVLVHGTPTLNTVYWHEQRSDDFCRQMARIAGLEAGDVIAFGHTHKPWHRVVDGIHFVNAGSVGRPKDGDPRAGWVIVEVKPGDVRVGFERVDYDVERAAAGILASDLPDEFAEYLRSGGTRLAAAAGGE